MLEGEDAGQLDTAELQTEAEVSEAQDEAQIDAPEDTEFDKEIEDVDLSDFDLKDLKDHQEAILDLTRKKRKAYDQAKRERLAKEQLQIEIEQLRSGFKVEEQEKIAGLQAELEAAREEVKQAMEMAQQEKNHQADLKFNHAAEKHDVKESEFIKFQLGKHLSSQEPEALSNFSIDAWMADMKVKHPVAFGGSVVEAREPANSSNAAPGAAAGSAGTEYRAGVGGKISKTAADRKKLNSEWETYKKQNNIR